MDARTVTDERVVPLLQNLIRNECVNTGADESGNETRSIDTLRTFLAEFGVAGEVYYKSADRANLVVRLPGTDPMAPSIAYMGHVDVVPADASSWQQDPFGGALIDGEVWGRGAIDMLGMVAASAGAISAIAEADTPPAGDILFIVVSDEEAGGTFGARYLSEHHWDDVKCDYMISEVGGMHIDTDRGPAITLTVGEKGICWARLKISGTPGHGSMPLGADNAAVKAAEAVTRLTSARTPTGFSPIVRRMGDAFFRGGYEKLLQRLPGGFRPALRRLYRREPGMARFLDTATRMTISPGMLTAGAKVNIIPDSAAIELDIRLLPGQTVEQTQEVIQRALGPLAEETTIEFFEFYPSNVSPVESPLRRATETICRDVIPGTEIVPMFLGGVTDGRYWRQRGTTVYGFAANSPELTMQRFSQRIHGTDERIGVTSLRSNLEYLYRLPYALSTETESAPEPGR